MSLLLLPSPRATTLLGPGSVAWSSISRDLVEVAVEVSSPGIVEIAAAPFGAFVPAKPLLQTAVGYLEPGERRRIAVRVERRKLPPPPSGIGKLFAHMPGLDAELIDLLDRASWDGNIHVSMDGEPAVEVHRALDIQLRTGQTGAATLFTGPEEVTVQANVAYGDGWEARVASMPGLSLLIVNAPDFESRASVVVHVTQPRSGRTVPVEFTFRATS